MPQTSQQPDSWFVVIANPQSKEKAEVAIEAAGFTAYRPALRRDVRHNRTKQQDRAAFPGLCLRPIAAAPFGKIRAGDGVRIFLGVQGRPTPIPTRLVEWLEIAEVTGAFDDVTPPAAVQPTYAVGDKVTVSRDHWWLGGEAGRVVATHGRHEVRLMLGHLAGMRPVQVSTDVLRAAYPSDCYCPLPAN